MIRCGAVAVSLLLTALPAAALADFAAAVSAYDRGDYETAFNEWLPLARDDDPAAQRNIAHLYRQGLGVAQDFSEAARWYRRAAYLGLTGAQSNLAAMYLRGQGVEENPEEAAYWFERAAVGGHILAQYNLGLMYSRGVGVRRSQPRAMAWLYLAAKSGHEQALAALSQMVLQEADTYGPPLPPPGYVEEPPPPAPVPEPVAESEPTSDVAAVDDATDDAEAPSEPTAADDDASLLSWLGALFSEDEAVAAETAPETTADADRTAAAAPPRPAEPATDTRTGATALAPTRQPVFAYVLDPPPGSRLSSNDGEPPDEAPVRESASPVPAASEPAPPIEPAQTLAARTPDDENSSAPLARDAAPQETLDVEPSAPAAEKADGDASADRVMASGLIAYYSGNFQVAFDRWLPIADAGHREAQYQLGLLLDRPDFNGRDRSRSFKWLQLAADQGHAQARDQLRRLEDDLTPLERLDGQRLVKDWREDR